LFNPWYWCASIETFLSHDSKPLDILKKGFSELSQRVKKKTDDLYAKLSWQEAISSADEQWLDGEGNTVVCNC